MNRAIKTIVCTVFILSMLMQIVPIVADETDDTVIRVIFSDDFEGGKPTVGTMNGTYTYSKVDAEHGQSLKFTSGSGRKYFYGENVSSDSIMDIISFDVYFDGLERSYTELFCDIDDSKGYYENYSRMWYLMEDGKTTYFTNFTTGGPAEAGVIRKPGKWYQMDICLDYNKQMIYYYIDNVLLDKRTIENEPYTYFKGMSYQIEGVKGGTVHYLDNIRFIQVLKAGVPFELDKNISFAQGIQNEIELDIDPKTIGAIYFSKDISFDVTMQNVFDEPRDFTVETTVITSNGVLCSQETREVTIPAKSAHKETYSATSDIYGYGTVYVNCTSKTTGRTLKDELEFSVLNGPAEPNPKWYMNDHSGGNPLAVGNGHGQERIDEKYELMKKSGIVGLRSNSVAPGYSAVAPGVFKDPDDWRLVADTLQKHGMKQLQIVSGKNINITSENPPKSDAAIAAYANFWGIVAAEYKKRGYDVDYMIWNEYNHVPFNPDGGTVEDYIRLQKACYKEIKANDPDAVVWGMGGITHIANYFEWMEEFLQKGGADSCDGFDIHPYAPASPAEDSYKIALKSQEIFEKYGYGDKPVLYSEIGYTSNTITEEQQRNYTIQLSAMTNDLVDEIAWYVNQEKDDNGDAEKKFGWIKGWTVEGASPKEPYSAKPVFVAATNWNRLMTGAKDSHEVVASDDDVKMWQLTDKSGQKITLAWKKTDGEKAVAFKVNCDSVRISDIYGNEIQTKIHNGIFNYVLTEDPIYIIGNYTEIDTAEPTFIVSENKITTAIDDEFDIFVMKTISADAKIQVKTPMNITILENRGFDKTGMAKIRIAVGGKERQGDKVEINVTSSDGHTVYLKKYVEIKYIDSIQSQIRAEYFRSKRWKGAITLKNVKRGESISGFLKITKPDFVAKYTPKIRFSNILPLSSKEITFNIPDTLADVMTTVEGEILLDTGEVYTVGNDIYFTSFLEMDKKPIIDGAMTPGEWDLSAPFDIKYPQQVQKITDWGGVNDISGKVYFQYDKENLYMYAEVKDNVHYAEDEQDRIWFVDSIQFAFCRERTVGAGRTEFSVGMMNGKPAFKREAYMGIDTGVLGWVDKEEYGDDEPELQITRNENKKVTIYEMRMPWKHIYADDINPTQQKVLYFSMLINDNDGDGRRGWLEFCPGIGVSKDPTAFKEVSVN